MSWARLPPAEPDVLKVRAGDQAVYCHGKHVRVNLHAGAWICSRCGKRLPWYVSS